MKPLQKNQKAIFFNKKFITVDKEKIKNITSYKFKTNENHDEDNDNDNINPLDM